MFSSVLADQYSLSGVYPCNNGNKENSNIVPPAGFNPYTIGNLQLKWTTDNLLDNQGNRLSVQSTVVISNDGNVYFADAGGTLYSYTENGQKNWSITLLDAHGNPDYFDESPIITESKVFIGGSYFHIVDRVTGQELASTPFDDDVWRFPSGSIEPSQLMIAGTNVVYGIGYVDEVSGGPDSLALYPYVRGKIVAFNQDTGARAWTLDLTTVGGTYGAGLGTFAGGAVDENLGLLFIGINQNYRPPVSPISDSLIAIDYQTGQIVWHYQYYANDICGIDIYGNFNCPIDGKHDFDVPAHPQLFTVVDPATGQNVDVVGGRGKDGTYRIFKRYQADPSNVVPLAQIQLDPGAGWNPTCGADPIYKDGILYVQSNSWVADMWNVDGTIDYSVDPLKATHVSTDLMPDLNNYYESSTFRAIDVQNLINYYHQQGATKPICCGKMQYRLCAGRIPKDSGIILWETFIHQSSVLSSSGLSYIDGMIAFGDLNGRLRFLRASDGVQVGTTYSLISPLWGDPTWDFYGLPILGGISAHNGKLYVPLGYDFQGFVTPGGGVAVFGY